jgi:hypothetical protein
MPAATAVKIRVVTGKFVAKHWPALEQNLQSFGNCPRNFAGRPINLVAQFLSEHSRNDVVTWSCNSAAILQRFE